MSGLLYKAIVAKLRTLSSLVSEVGETTTDRRIIRCMPEMPAKANLVTVNVRTTVPSMMDGPTKFQYSSVELDCVSESETKVIAMADIIDVAMHTNTNVGFYDFTSLSDNIRNCQTRWRSRTNPEYDKDTDKWTIRVVIDLWWFSTASS